MDVSRFPDIRESLVRAVRGALESLGLPEAEFSLERPPSASKGDFSTTAAFDLAKRLKQPPRAIASEIAARLVLPSGVASSAVEGAGYLNFRLERGPFVAAMFRDRRAPATALAGKVIVEHTNINPNKAAHIGHLRNAVLGDTLVRCLRHLGHAVEVQNYIDDTGVQVADVVVGFLDSKRWTLEQIDGAIQDPASRGARYRSFGDLCWDVYADVGRDYEERPESKGLRAETLHAMEEGGNLRAAAAEKISAAIVAEHVATMGRIGVAYDLLPRESDILKKHFWSRAFALLKEREAIALETEGRHAGCWVMRLSSSEAFAGLDEPDKILVRSNGTVTYTGKDIAYQLWKFGRLGLDFDYARYEPDWDSGRGGAEAVPAAVRSHPVWQTLTGAAGAAPAFGNAGRVFNVIDVRQSYPQKVVQEGLRVLGFTEQADASIHFSYEMVALTPRTVRRLHDVYGDEYRLSEEDEKKSFVEMSGRKGQGVKAHDLLEAMVEQALAQIRGRDPGLSDDEARNRAREIAVGALRYFLLKFGRTKILAFDFDEALNFEGDTGPYLQYSSVRVENIFRKLEATGISTSIGPESAERLAALEWPDDLWEIFLEVSRVREIVERAVSTLELAAVARHAFSLAQLFSQFYHRHPIAQERDEDLRLQRIAVARAYQAALESLLGLLGIPSPERM
ncbi:MAG: arginine--tRNA ligase [Thermoanaerobaculia bacterium]